MKGRGGTGEATGLAVSKYPGTEESCLVLVVVPRPVAVTMVATVVVAGRGFSNPRGSGCRVGGLLGPRLVT
jgi:hypothetical protein